MIYYSNDCYGCATESYPCLGESCPVAHTKHYVCDYCKEELDEGELYWYEGEQLCIDCVRNRLEQVD